MTDIGQLQRGTCCLPGLMVLVVSTEPRQNQPQATSWCTGQWASESHAIVLDGNDEIASLYAGTLPTH